MKGSIGEIGQQRKRHVIEGRRSLIHTKWNYWKTKEKRNVFIGRDSPCWTLIECAVVGWQCPMCYLISSGFSDRFGLVLRFIGNLYAMSVTIRYIRFVLRKSFSIADRARWTQDASSVVCINDYLLSQFESQFTSQWLIAVFNRPPLRINRRPDDDNLPFQSTLNSVGSRW